MRVALGGFMHESATFSHVPTGLQDFRILQGDALTDAIRQDRSELAGARAALEEAGIHMVPTLYAVATPSGLVSEETFYTLKSLFLEHVTQAMRTSPLDGVIVALHGSTTVSGVPDAQGALVSALRQALGPRIPIVATLDLHATPSDQVIGNLDALVAYRTAPHRDQADTGARAARILLRILRTGQRPSITIARLPLLLPGELGQTDIEPMPSLMRTARELEATHPEIWSVSVLQGYPWADLEDPGASVLAVLDGDHGRRGDAEALEAVRMLAGRVWEARKGLHQSVEVLPVPRALDVARSLSAKGRLVYLCDSGDNPTAGADADDARLLPVLLASGLPHITLACLADPVAVAAARSAGIGGQVRLEVGGRPSDRPEVAAAFCGTVAAFSHDPEGGEIARLTQGPVDLLVSERRMGVRTPTILAETGIDPEAPGSVHVLKSGYLFPALTDLVARTPGARSILMATPGASSLDLRQIPYRVLRRPVYPLDPDMQTQVAVRRRPPLDPMVQDA